MKLLWIILLVLFILVNVYAFVAGDQLDGFFAFLQNPGPWGLLTVVDLLIALTVALSFIARDARRIGVNPAPYFVLTLFTGSTGILIYLIRYWDSSRAHRVESEGVVRREINAG